MHEKILKSITFVRYKLVSDIVIDFRKLVFLFSFNELKFFVFFCLATKNSLNLQKLLNKFVEKFKTFDFSGKLIVCGREF